MQRPPPRDVGADSHSMREKSACAALNRTPSANGGAVPASDHLSIARRSAQADDHATKTLLFEVPLNVITVGRFHFTGFSGCPTKWGGNPIAAKLFRSVDNENKSRFGSAQVDVRQRRP